MYVCMHACMYVCMYGNVMYVCMCACMYVCMHVWMYVCSQNRHTNTMSRGEWQRPVLAPCRAVRADRDESRRSAAGAWRTQKVASFKQSQNELRRDNCQVRQVRNQQHEKDAFCHPGDHQSQAGGISATPATQTAHRWVHVSSCHACHAECTSMLPSATPATQNGRRCRQVPRLPHKQPPRPRRQVGTKRATKAISATPARQNECHACHADRHHCRQVPHLPRKQPRRPRRQLGPKHAYHAKCTSMSPSATPATQSEGRCHQLPRLPRKVKVNAAKCHACHANSRGVHGVNWDPSAPPEPVQCQKCNTCHAKCTSMSPSATPATPSDRRCHQVPRLPRKVKVNVTKCLACHAK